MDKYENLRNWKPTQEDLTIRSLDNVPKWNKIWTLEYHDECEGWEIRGHFTTKEKAEEYLEVLKKEWDDVYDETSEFRIDWHYVDRGYWD